jgi:PAS domain S-box-containing protein
MDGNASLEGGLVDQMPIGLVVTDRKGTVARWNRTAGQLFGWGLKEVLGRKIDALARPNGDVEALRELIAMAASGESWEGELALCDKAGATLCVHLRASALRTHEGAVVGVVIAVLDAEAGSPRGTSSAETGVRLAQARKQAGLTQKALAERLGVTRRSIQGYEAGTVVPYKHLERLGGILDRPPSWFLGGDQPVAVKSVPVAELRAALHEELVAVFSELGASSEQLRRGELAAERVVRSACRSECESALLRSFAPVGARAARG